MNMNLMFDKLSMSQWVRYEDTMLIGFNYRRADCSTRGHVSIFEAIGSCRGELLERLQEKRESLWEKWETEDSKLEGGWRSWRWWSGRPFADSVGLGADCPAHRPRGVSQASSQESVSWVSGYNNGQPTLTRLQWRVSKLLLLILVCNEKWVVMWCRPD